MVEGALGPGRMRGPGWRGLGGALTWCAARSGTRPAAAGPRRGPGPGSRATAAATAPARSHPCPRSCLPLSRLRADQGSRGLSLRVARLRDSARAQEAGQAVAPPGCHRGPSLKVPGLASPGTPPAAPPPGSPTRTAPLTHTHRPARPSPPAWRFWNAARLPPPPPHLDPTPSPQSPPGGRKEKGLEPRGKGLRFPRLDPLKAQEKGISVLSWK